MPEMVKVLPVMLSVLLVSTSLSVSACDLSCWLDQRRSDCHSTGPATKESMDAASAMEMSAEMEMDSQAKQGQKTLSVRANSHMRHVMSAQMEMTRREPQVISQSKLSGNAAFAHSGTPSACNHETCNQAEASSSPPRRSQGRSPDLHRAVIRASIPANLLTNSNQITPAVPSLIDHPAHLHSPLRI